MSQKNCKCPYCGKMYSTKGIGTHIWRNHGNGKAHDPNISNKGKPSWNSGKTQDTDLRVKANAESIRKTIAKKRKSGSLKCTHLLTLEERQRISKQMSEHNPGGRCRWFKVNGIKVQGTWERDFALQLTKLKIVWSRPSKAVTYLQDGKLKHYTPDFYLKDFDTFVEIKGYWWPGCKAKMRLVFQQNPNLRGRIAVLTSADKVQKFLFKLTK
jgi:hypothetical protein